MTPRKLVPKPAWKSRPLPRRTATIEEAKGLIDLIILEHCGDLAHTASFLEELILEAEERLTNMGGRYAKAANKP